MAKPTVNMQFGQWCEFWPIHSKEVANISTLQSIYTINSFSEKSRQILREQTYVKPTTRNKNTQICKLQTYVVDLRYFEL